MEGSGQHYNHVHFVAVLQGRLSLSSYRHLFFFIDDFHIDCERRDEVRGQLYGE